jgi:hypothetical protein
MDRQQYGSSTPTKRKTRKTTRPKPRT